MRASTGKGPCPATAPVGLKCALEDGHPEQHWDSFEGISWAFWDVADEEEANPHGNYHCLGPAPVL